jgi:hypothetical protein
VHVSVARLEHVILGQGLAQSGVNLRLAKRAAGEFE